MIRSMTGYGRSESVRDNLRLTVEMRAVNHRFCEILVRLPKTWGMLEDRVRKRVAQYVRRGRVDVFIAVDWNASTPSGVAIDWSAAEQYVWAARQLNEQFSLTEPLSAKDLLLLPGVVQKQEPTEAAPEDIEEWLIDVVEEAAHHLLSMKEAEGRQLYQDITHRLALVSAWAKEIRQLAPAAVEEYRSRLQQRIGELAEHTPFDLDHQRLAQEIALFADRSDISEETTRLLSHCTQFTEQLTKDEAVGRKLDFLLQEMNREANTMASKANHLPIQRLAVEIKTELEKMREQVQNVE
ncbi:YicC/YloC family endoribonuclease [Brevibacillus sp. H7]|jgi:uncharacterized protein (TIGR00255 family)|uniref:YicC/YloC family endoribonuclease n=1 Tax=Brevibacillus sp. H7 TaxID=3349138 RepID=UPI003816C0E5